jgi:hypothetical protein
MNPVIHPLTGISKRSKHRLTQKLPPHRLPEPLDLAQRHRMMGRAADMVDPLLFEHLLEPRTTPPGHKLPPVVREDLSRRTPLADRPLGHL